MLCPSKNLCTAYIEIMAEVTFCKTKNGTCVGRQYITDRTAFTDTVVAYESFYQFLQCAICNHDDPLLNETIRCHFFCAVGPLQITYKVKNKIGYTRLV